MNVPAAASCHRRHLDEHMDRGDTMRTPSNTCTPAGALPQTLGRVTASLGTAPSRSVAALHALVAAAPPAPCDWARCRSEEHTSELQSHSDLVCRLLLEKKKNTTSRCVDYQSSAS